MSDSRTTFLTAATAFVDQVARIPVDGLTGPGLGDWDLRSLVGHTSRSLVTVETYLGQPADRITVPTAAAYYLAIAGVTGADSAAVTERGRQAGAAMGPDPARFVGDLAARVAEVLTAYDDDHVLTTIAGGMRLGDYLRTRVFELVVHGLDIEAASGVGPAFADGPLLDAARLAAEVAVLGGRASDLLLAATGRRPLPDGFSVV